jgi:hypothetical protein
MQLARLQPRLLCEVWRGISAVQQLHFIICNQSAIKHKLPSNTIATPKAVPFESTSSSCGAPNGPPTQAKKSGSPRHDSLLAPRPRMSVTSCF